MYTNFDLFIFDLDGTLVDTEPIHQEAYNLAFKECNLNLEFDLNDYYTYVHGINSLEAYINEYIDKYNTYCMPYNKIYFTFHTVYQTKQRIYNELIEKREITYIRGAKEFINNIKNKNKNMCIVTHTNRETFNILSKKLDLLEFIDTNYKVYTRDDYNSKKPSPECYLKALEYFKPRNPIGFEDSLKGFKSLENANITPVFVGSTNYLYYSHLNPLNSILDYTCLLEDNNKIKLKNKLLDYVAIVGSGLGTRMYPLSVYIPKVLITLNNKIFINDLLDYWSQYTDNILLVIHSKYKLLIEYYISFYSNLNIKLICLDEHTSGTAETINENFKDYYNKNILFTWCDIVPNQDINLYKLTSNTVFTFGDECRYIVKDGQVIKQDRGDVIGMYYIQNYHGFLGYKLGDDICDVMNKNYNNITTYALEQVIDIGDMPKFRKYTVKNYFQTRFFNNITILDDTRLLKSSLNNQGTEIIKKEINWYKNLEGFKHIPKIYNTSDSSFEIEYIKDSCPLYDEFVNSNNKLDLVLKLVNIIDELHNYSSNIQVPKDIIMRDLQIECVDKVYDRLKIINNIINHFGEIKYVNGLEIDNLSYVLDTCFDIIKSNVNSYTIIHGDCHFNNVLYKDGELYLIDPRGYFGQTKIYGSPEYDYAKILYTLTGYNYLNNTDEYAIINLTEDSIELDIKNYSELYDKLPEKLFNKCTIAFVTIIWISLAQYISNNPLKAISSIYYGLWFFKKYLK